MNTKNQVREDRKQNTRHSQLRKSNGKEKLRTIWCRFDNQLIAAADEAAAKLGLTRDQFMVSAIENQLPALENAAGGGKVRIVQIPFPAAALPYIDKAAMLFGLSREEFIDEAVREKMHKAAARPGGHEFIRHAMETAAEAVANASEARAGTFQAQTEETLRRSAAENVVCGALETAMEYLAKMRPPVGTLRFTHDFVGQGIAMIDNLSKFRGVDRDRLLRGALFKGLELVAWDRLQVERKKERQEARRAKGGAR